MDEEHNEYSEEHNDYSKEQNENSEEKNEDSEVNPWEQRLTRSLRSGSDTSLSKSGYSTPYLMCSASDVASAIIDFSRENVDEGVVDSLPSQRPTRTSICSMSPLKRAPSIPTQSCLHSPTLCTQITPHKKLCVDAEKDGGEYHANDGVSLPIAPAHLPLYISNFKTNSICKDRKRKAQLNSSTASQIPHFLENGSLPSKSIRGESSFRTLNPSF